MLSGEFLRKQVSNGLKRFCPVEIRAGRGREPSLSLASGTTWWPCLTGAGPPTNNTSEKEERKECMATQLGITEQDIRSSSTPAPAKVQAIQKVVPIKGGIFGPQGSGKSATTALIAAAYSALYCNRAPVGVIDPEAAWPFLKRRIFDV